MKVPFCDLAKLNRYYGWVLKEAYNRVTERGLFILGPEVDAFEEEWAAYCGKRYAVAVGNGTEALSMILRAHGIGDGMQVIVPAHTCVATWLAVSMTGAIPVPIDVDSMTFNLDPDRIAEARIDVDLVAIIAVHMHGWFSDVHRLRSIAAKLGVPLFIDAAQAHGAKGDLLGAAAAFSFYPTKNLGALGDGGAVVTDDEGLADEIRWLRNLGMYSKDVHVRIAGNSRMDELQAAFLRAKLPRLDASNARRKRNAELYRGGGSSTVNHHVVILSRKRDELRQMLRRWDIDTMVHYPTPPHLQPCYEHLGYGVGSFPVAEKIARFGVSLPCGPELSLAQAQFVGEQVFAAEAEVWT